MTVKHNAKFVLLHENNSAKDQVEKTGTHLLIFSSLVKHVFSPQQKARFTGGKKMVFSFRNSTQMQKDIFFLVTAPQNTLTAFSLNTQKFYILPYYISGPLLAQLLVLWVALDKTRTAALR